MLMKLNDYCVGPRARSAGVFPSFHSGPVAGTESSPVLMADDLLSMIGSIARTCLEGSRPLAPSALGVNAKRSAPSPPVLGAPHPLRLVKAPAAGHPLPQGARAGTTGSIGASAGPPTPARGEGCSITRWADGKSSDK